MKLQSSHCTLQGVSEGEDNSHIAQDQLVLWLCDGTIISSILNQLQQLVYEYNRPVSDNQP